MNNKQSHLALFSGIYAVFYSFCLYKNLGGATFPFFVAGTLFYIWLSMREFGLTWKKDSLIEVIAAILVGINQMLTYNSIMQFLNVCVVFVLLFHIMLHQFSEDGNWNLLQHLWNLFLLFLSMFGHFLQPFVDFLDLRKNKKSVEGAEGKQKFPYHIVILTILVCLPVLAFVIILLSSADAVFEHMVDTLVFDFDLDFLKPVVLAVFIFFFAYACISKLTRFSFPAEEKKPGQANPLIAITAGIMFDIVYVIFSVIQIFYLFIGKFTLPDGYTYAEYAREGYFELLFVCFINLCLVLAGILFFENNKTIRIILSVLSGCTYIMILSSAFRMILYIRYYYFSFLRIFVLWSLILFAALLTGLLVQIWNKNFHLFKYCVTACAVCYVALAFMFPDYCIARWNLNNSGADKSSFFLAEESYSDYDYLIWELSPDAADVIMENEALRDDFLESTIRPQLDGEKFGIRNYNVSAVRAQKYLKD